MKKTKKPESVAKKFLTTAGKNFTASLILMALLSVSSVFNSCSKVANLLTYNLAMQTASITVPIPPESNTSSSVTFGTETTNYNIDSFIRASTLGSLGISNIKSVKLLSCVLTLQNSSTQDNFANLESCYASFTTGSNQPYSISVSNNQDEFSNSLSLPVDTTVQLNSYLTGNNFTYSLGGQLRRATTDTLKCTIQFTYSIKVQG